MIAIKKAFRVVLIVLAGLLGLYVAAVVIVAVLKAPEHQGVGPSLLAAVRAHLRLGMSDRPVFSGVVIRNKDFQSLYVDKGPHFNDGNTAVGEDVMRYVKKSAGRDSQYNTGVGTHALRALTKGSDNTALGAQALRDLTVGYHNTAVGHYALGRTTTGGQNTALGAFSLNENRSGRENTAI